METTAAVHTLDFGKFDGFVTRTPIVLLEVASFGSRGAPEHVAAVFRDSYGDAFAHARISVSVLPYPEWLVERLAPAHLEAVPVGGLYLFLGGKAAKFHRGESLAGFTEAVIDFAVAVATKERFQPAYKIRSEEILAAFAPAAAEFMRAQDRRASTANTSREAEDNARRVLGVRADATEADIDKAWKKLRGEYAPDRVQHVSDAFVRLASEKVLGLDRARELLLQRRRSG
jgi:hypothetical protein